MDQLPDLDLDDDDAMSHPDGESDAPQSWDMGGLESIAANPNNRNASIGYVASNSTSQKKPFDINKVSMRDSIDEDDSV